MSQRLSSRAPQPATSARAFLASSFTHRRPHLRRGLSSSSASIVFDRQLKQHHRTRAALAPSAQMYDYLRDEVAERLMERLEDVHSSYTFPEAVDLACGSGHVRRALVTQCSPLELKLYEEVVHVLLQLLCNRFKLRDASGRRVRRHLDGSIPSAKLVAR